MNVDEYVAARYMRLLERAIELGAPDGLATEYVDQVLLDQRRAISRSDDPDPVVLEALERAVLKLPEPRRSRWPLVGVGLAGVAVAVGVILTQEPETAPMPALFGYTGEQAEELLEDQGYDVVLRPVRECEPIGQVLTSAPQAREPVETGGRIDVFTAVPSGSGCEAQFVRRSDAWQFLDFAVTGESTPTFAETVTVVIDGVEGDPRSGFDAAASPRWASLRELIATQSHAEASTPTGQPMLTVTPVVPPLETCGYARPPGAGERQALRIEVDVRPIGADTGCPLTIDLYRDSERVIDAVVVYSALDPP